MEGELSSWIKEYGCHYNDKTLKQVLLTDKYSCPLLRI